MLVAFSCKQRGLCPSCSAKRGAGFGAFLIDHFKEDVGHAQWVFSIPKMFRPLFFKMRHLRGHLARLAWETVRDDGGVRPEVRDPARHCRTGRSGRPQRL